ncbi:hypothetical protein [Paracoccus fistulariae]|uniref:Uncharacterized protein n=1 Tax=Paracoccus fistulariae TaxID=658446 RepID=A0ABY7SPC3_9RHOB|nr:hypothetical protein [Paracoccus fistulariae]MDB6183058.1 hypothetical protein [Paracoccus fistulariae]WCR08852.1 hypothetical protein JHX87_08705 [Paracoccus fistulariae]
MAIASAAFSVASSLTGYLSRGANPTVPLLISLHQAVEAMGLQIEAIDMKLELILSELAELRQDVLNIPENVQLSDAYYKMREPYTAFLELDPDAHKDEPSDGYLRALPSIFDRLQIARRIFVDVSMSGNRLIADGAPHLALAQDAEILIGADMLRVEMMERGLQIDPQALLGALGEYEAFFRATLDPDVPASFTAIKISLMSQIQEIVARSWISDDLIELRETVMCWSTHTSCLVADPISGHCYEPGPGIRMEHQSFSYSKTGISDSPTVFPDEIAHPFIYEVINNNDCPLALSSIMEASIDRQYTSTVQQVEALNALIISAYKAQYFEALCRRALDINLRHQSNIMAALGVSEP